MPLTVFPFPLPHRRSDIARLQERERGGREFMTAYLIHRGGGGDAGRNVYRLSVTSWPGIKH